MRDGQSKREDIKDALELVTQKVDDLQSAAWHSLINNKLRYLVGAAPEKAV